MNSSALIERGYDPPRDNKVLRTISKLSCNGVQGNKIRQVDPVSDSGMTRVVQPTNVYPAGTYLRRQI